MRERLLQRLYRLMDSPQGAVLGGFCYGLWALLVNRHAGWPHAALIGSIHWLMSALLTYGSVTLMRSLFRLPSDPRAGFLLSAAGSLTLTYSMLITVHHAIGTPHIVMTLAPGFAPTVTFALVYSTLLLRHAQRSVSYPTLAECLHAEVELPGGHDARA